MISCSFSCASIDATAATSSAAGASGAWSGGAVYAGGFGGALYTGKRPPRDGDIAAANWSCVTSSRGASDLRRELAVGEKSRDGTELGAVFSRVFGGAFGVLTAGERGQITDRLASRDRDGVGIDDVRRGVALNATFGFFDGTADAGVSAAAVGEVASSYSLRRASARAVSESIASKRRSDLTSGVTKSSSAARTRATAGVSLDDVMMSASELSG